MPAVTPETVSANQAAHELAAILATGIRRLKSRNRLPQENSLNLVAPASHGLEFVPDPRLTVSGG